VTASYPEETLTVEFVACEEARPAPDSTIARTPRIVAAADKAL